MKKLIKILMALTIIVSMAIGLMPDLSVHAASITYHKTFEDAAVELGKGMAAREERIPVGLDMSLAMKLYGDEAAAQKIIEKIGTRASAGIIYIKCATLCRKPTQSSINKL
jgi:hypothetical protein